MNNTNIKFLWLIVLAAPGLLWAGERKTIAPLLTSHWHQQAPYNGLSPVVADGQVKTVAGCVAIAASQIAYYWRRDNPEITLRDTPVYPYGNAPVTYSVPSGTPYNWHLMRDSYDGSESQAERDAVALLTYVVGTSAYLNFGSSTGGQISDIIYYSYYSQLHLLSEYATKADYSQEQWEELVYEELLLGRPVLYSGTKQGVGGHAVVIDGYDAQTGLFHFNFGWGGSQDGYYTVDDVTGMDGYCKSQHCVYQIKPMHRNITASMATDGQLSVGVSSKVQVTIANNSTLPVHGLRVYLTSDVEDIADYEPVAHSSEVVANDGKQQVVDISIKPSVAGSSLLLSVYTDDGDFLCSTPVEVSAFSGITGVSVGERLKISTVTGGLRIEPYSPIAVSIYTVGGQCCWEQMVQESCVVSLDNGIYIVNGRKYVVK